MPPRRSNLENFATGLLGRGCPKMMKHPRHSLPVILVTLVVGWVGWYIYSGWGLVTLRVENAPVGKVLASISKQGGIEIVSNLDPSATVSLDVKRVPPVEALDIVAIRTDSSWRLAYLGAPDRGAIETVLGSFRTSGDTSGWSSHGRMGFTMFSPASGEAVDLRNIRWEPSDEGELHALLEDAGSKTGVLLAAPSDWHPNLSAPKPGPIAKAAPALFSAAGGVSREVFLVRGSPARDGQDEPAGRMARRRELDRRRTRRRPPPREGGFGRGMGNPERMAARAEAQIALLPKEEQAKAREELDAMRKIWLELRDLPEDERRAKMQEILDRPEVAERMEQRQLARDSKMSPDQRIQRSKSYWERKNNAKSRQEGGNP